MWPHSMWIRSLSTTTEPLILESNVVKGNLSDIKFGAVTGEHWIRH